MSDVMVCGVVALLCFAKLSFALLCFACPHMRMGHASIGIARPIAYPAGRPVGLARPGVQRIGRGVTG